MYPPRCTGGGDDSSSLPAVVTTARDVGLGPGGQQVQVRNRRRCSVLVICTIVSSRHAPVFMLQSQPCTCAYFFGQYVVCPGRCSRPRQPL